MSNHAPSPPLTMMKPSAPKNVPDADLTWPLTRDAISQPTHPTAHSHANRAATSHAMLIVASNRQLPSPMLAHHPDAVALGGLPLR